VALSIAERSARYRARKRSAGVIAITLRAPAATAPDFYALAEALRARPDLSPALLLKDPRTGRLVSVKTALRRTPFASWRSAESEAEGRRDCK
jgi:hypothetical protein